MKQKRALSIQARVTIWYTLSIALLMLLGAGYLLSMTQQLSRSQLQSRLRDVVAQTVQDTHFRYGELDDEELDFYTGGVSIQLYDTEGHLLAPKGSQRSRVDAILTDGSLRAVTDWAGEEWLVYDQYAIQDDTAFWVRGAASLAESTHVLENLLELLLISLPLLLLAAALGGWFITRRAFRPIGQMARTAGAISSGSDLSRRVEYTRSGDEVARLGQTLNEMLSRLQGAFERERQFSSDVSHELRTPIAVIRSQCDYCLSPQASDSDRQEGLEAIQRQAERMSRMVGQLLMLSRADNGRFVPQIEAVDLSQLCQMCLLEAQPAAQKAQVALQDAVEPELVLSGDETLLLRLVENLLSNAIRYNKPGGSVRLCLRRQDQSLVLQVADTGQGIPPEELPKIWDRFYRGDASRSSEGTGLGLSMVQWIAQVHRAQVQVESQPGQGSCFTVTFPLS